MSPTILNDFYHLARQFNNEKREKMFVIRTDRQDSDIFSNCQAPGPGQVKIQVKVQVKVQVNVPV